MLTKNAFNVIMSFMGNKDTTVITHNGTSLTFSATTGNKGMQFEYLKSGTCSTSFMAATRFGTGVTPATADDYNLESRIDSGLTVANPSAVSLNSTADCIELSATYGLTNKTTTSIAISEIGVFGAQASGVTDTYLLDRTVLKKPITINPGESKQVTYTIRFNYPTEV